MDQRAELERLAAGLRRAVTERGRDRALAAVGLASAATAHDMATPLLVIRGYARMRIDQLDAESELRKDLERIDRAAEFCQGLASSTLAQARGGERSGKSYSLLQAVERALSLSEEILDGSGIAVRREYAADDLIVRGEPQELERLFINLIGNAAKIMADGGALTVRVRVEESAGAREAFVRMDDTGPGVPAEILPNLFSPFATTRAAQGGTGLGLYMCRETARRYGGDLSAENLPEGGASFLVRLPLAAASTAAV
jgi:two-component system C4-dicarboxylate transport sensor histidine kinase DctB